MIGLNETDLSCCQVHKATDLRNFSWYQELNALDLRTSLLYKFPLLTKNNIVTSVLKSRK